MTTYVTMGWLGGLLALWLAPMMGGWGLGLFVAGGLAFTAGRPVSLLRDVLLCVAVDGTTYYLGRWRCGCVLYGIADCGDGGRGALRMWNPLAL
jgi:hypothetical protein